MIMRKKLLLIFGLFIIYNFCFSQEYLIIEGITVDETEEEFVANEIILTPNNPENIVNINIGDSDVDFNAGYKIKLKPGFSTKTVDDQATGKCTFKINSNLRLNLTNEEFIIGTWRDPVLYPGDSELWGSSKLEEVKEAYFNLLTGIHTNPRIKDSVTEEIKIVYQDLEANRQYLKLASNVGLKYMISDIAYKGSEENEVGDIVGSYRPSDLRKYEDRLIERNDMIDNYKNIITIEERNAMFGYTFGDEPLPIFDSNVQKWIRFINNWETEKLTHISLYASYQGDIGKDGFEDYLNLYLKDSDTLNNVDVFSFDHYTLWDKYDNDFSPSYFYDYGIVKKVSQETGKSFWGMPLVQSSPEEGILDPGEDDIRLMSFVPIAYGAKGLLFFRYNGTMNKIPAEDDIAEKTKKYNQVQNINHYIRDIIEPVIMNSYYLGYWHQDDSYLNYGHDFELNELINENTPLVDSCSSIDLMISIFNTNSVLDTSNAYYDLNEYYILLQNKSAATIYNSKVYFTGDFQNKISLSPRVGDITPVDNGDSAGQVTPYHTLGHKYYYIQDSKVEYFTISDHTELTIDHMRGGEARFIKVKINNDQEGTATPTSYTNSSDSDLSMNLDDIADSEIKSFDVNIYPNPNNGSFNINIPNNSSSLSIEVFNLAGQNIFTGFIKENYYQMDISNEDAGIYFVKISSNNQYHYSKILKIK